MTDPNTEQPKPYRKRCKNCKTIWLLGDDGDYCGSANCQRAANTEQPADTSIDEILQNLCNEVHPLSQAAKFYGIFIEGEPMKESKQAILSWHQSQTAALLKRVREEVIDIEYIADYTKYGKCDVCGDYEYSHNPDGHKEAGAREFQLIQRKALDSLEKEMMG